MVSVNSMSDCQVSGERSAISGFDQPAAVHEIGEPQDPRFFQLLGLFLSHANNDAAVSRISSRV